MLATLLPLAQQTMPTLDGMYWLNLASRILHIVGAMILVGGLFYLRTVVMPSPAAAHAQTVDEKFGGLRAKWAMWIGIATLLLLVTGLWNFIYIVKHSERMASSYHMIFGLKFLAGLALFLLAALVAGRSVAAEVVRERMRLWVGVCLVLGILAAALGSVLRSYPHNPKIDTVPAPTLVAPANPAATQ
jgi:uncharacterized membrane protein